MTAQTNYALAQRGAHTQRQPDREYKWRSVTGQVPAKLQAKALADFRMFYRKATDAETRAYCAAEIKRLGGQP